MASSVPAKKNTAYSFEMSLVATAGGSFVTNPTLATGDVKVSKDGGSFANVTDLPTAIDSGDVIIVTLTATEMNADKVIVAFRDVAGAEWLACNASIRTAAQTLDETDAIVDSILTDTAEIGAAGAGLTNINLPNQTMDIVGNITGNLSGSVGSVTGLTASDVGAIKTKTDNLPTDPADASVIAGLIATAQADLDTITGADGVTLATLQGNYAPSTHAAADVWSVGTRLLTAGTNIVLAKGTGVTGFNDLSAAQVNAEADTALADYDPPTKTEMDTAFTEIKGATWATTDTLEAIRDRGDAAWITATGFSTHSAADVWSVGTRVLTASTNLGDLDDAILAILGTPADTDIATDIANISAGGAPTADQNADALLDRADAIETGLTVRQALRLNTAVTAGKASGARSGTETFRNAVADTKDRLVVTNDAFGNRTAVVTDVT